MTWPWSLLALIAVAAAAIWALLRPGRQLIVVPSLSLWAEALQSMDRAKRRRSRRITAEWLILLAGAVLAVLAAARIVYHSGRPARRVGLALCPSAELASARAMAGLRAAATALLDRLTSADRVRLVLPAAAGGQSDWLSPEEARRRVRRIEPVPVRADQLILPHAADDVQHVYRFVPAGAAGGDGPNVTTISLPAAAAPASLAAVGAEPMPDGGVQVFAAISNRTGRAGRAPLVVWTAGRDLLLAKSAQSEVALPAWGRGQAVVTCPAAQIIVVQIGRGAASAEWPGLRAFLVRRRARPRNVAMLGRDEPMLRRFVSVSPSLKLVARPADADVVIANGVDPPPGAAALIVHPPAPPRGWRAGRKRNAVVLGGTSAAGDDPVMKHVDLAGVAVRRLTGWVSGDRPGEKTLASLAGEAVILRTRPSAVSGPRPRRIYVAFEMSRANTNFAMSSAFVIFLANSMRWLAPPGRGAAGYEFTTPRQAGRRADWKPLPLAAPGGQANRFAPRRGGPYPWPGLYRDAAGRLHAVSLTGLKGGDPALPFAQAAARAPLPPPEVGRARLELWPVLTAAAMLCWLIGWAIRAR